MPVFMLLPSPRLYYSPSLCYSQLFCHYWSQNCSWVALGANGCGGYLMESTPPRPLWIALPKERFQSVCKHTNSPYNPGVSNSFCPLQRGPEGTTKNVLFFLAVKITKTLSSIHYFGNFQCSLTVCLSFRWLLVSWTQSRNSMNVGLLYYHLCSFDLVWIIFKVFWLCFPPPTKYI